MLIRSHSALSACTSGKKWSRPPTTRSQGVGPTIAHIGPFCNRESLVLRAARGPVAKAVFDAGADLRRRETRCRRSRGLQPLVGSAAGVGERLRRCCLQLESSAFAWPGQNRLRDVDGGGSGRGRKTRLGVPLGAASRALCSCGKLPHLGFLSAAHCQSCQGKCQLARAIHAS